MTLPPLKCRCGRLSEVSLLGAISIVLVKNTSLKSWKDTSFIAGPGGKWIKIFMSTEEVKALTMEALLQRIIERFPSLGKRSVVGLKYLDGNDWFELLADDLDSFIGMIETATVERENLKRITVKVNELAFTPPRSEIAADISEASLNITIASCLSREKYNRC